jgi:transcriptional regulator with XRE-family HTH domain
MNSEPDPKLVRAMIQRVLDEAPFSMRQLAEEAGISYDAIRSWAADRRTPRSENLEHLARALERRGTRLQAIADDVRQVTRSGGNDAPPRT